MVFKLLKHGQFLKIYRFWLLGVVFRKSIALSLLNFLHMYKKTSKNWIMSLSLICIRNYFYNIFSKNYWVFECPLLRNGQLVHSVYILRGPWISRESVTEDMKLNAITNSHKSQPLIGYLAISYCFYDS